MHRPTAGRRTRRLSSSTSSRRRPTSPWSPTGWRARRWASMASTRARRRTSSTRTSPGRAWTRTTRAATARPTQRSTDSAGTISTATAGPPWMAPTPTTTSTPLADRRADARQIPGARAGGRAAMTGRPAAGRHSRAEGRRTRAPAAVAADVAPSSLPTSSSRRSSRAWGRRVSGRCWSPSWSPSTRTVSSPWPTTSRGG
mmetsp:Transcript_68328/g.191477  ORF Transcript_68328/g.191477 Transcript_68328/m.191477 type:complete len:200 (+) Transcript_68328:225-824(+)